MRRADAREGQQSGWWLVAARHLEGFEDGPMSASTHCFLSDITTSPHWTRSRTLVRTWRLVRLQIAASPQTPLSRELRDQFLGARRERTESRCEVVARGSSCARGGEKEDRRMSSVNYGVVCRGFECGSIASVFGGRFDGECTVCARFLPRFLPRPDSIALGFSGASSAAFADNSSARVFGIATLCSATS